MCNRLPHQADCLSRYKAELTVKRLKYITPLFIESVTSSDLLGAGEEEREGEEGHGARVVHAHAEQHQEHHHDPHQHHHHHHHHDGHHDAKTAKGIKYRVVNLFGSAMKLHFRSRYTKNVMALVKPSGSDWRSLDEWVLPHFATAVTAQVSDRSHPHGKDDKKSPKSEWLSLERSGAVTIPGVGCVAEMLSPSPSHKLILLGAPLRVHNQTDLTLVVRFHDAQKRAVIPVDLRSSSACEASLLGSSHSCDRGTSIFSGRIRQLPETSLGELLLPPHTICSVPAAALVQTQQAELTSTRTFLSVRPAGLELHFCAPVEAGVGVKTCSLFCRGPEAPSGSPSSKRVCRTSGVHFLCQSTSHVHPLPSPTAVTTIAIQPTLAILNALPLGCLGLRYTTKPEENKYLEATEATVQSFSRRHIYSFPGVRREGLAIIARLDASAPWSAPAKFSWDAFNKEAADGGQFLQLRQESGGAGAGVFFEPMSHYEIRVTCPNWLVDRSGVPAPMKLAIHYQGRPLPSANGLTLLHSECLEESCEFVMTTPSGGTSELKVRVPPNFSVLPWKSLLGDQVFCLQAEDVTPEDVHGAQCQVTKI
eukprot:s118_g4.t1